MKKFFKRLIIRSITFITNIILSVVLILELTFAMTILNLIYLLSGKEYDYGTLTTYLTSQLDKTQWIE